MAQTHLNKIESRKLRAVISQLLFVNSSSDQPEIAILSKRIETSSTFASNKGTKIESIGINHLKQLNNLELHL